MPTYNILLMGASYGSLLASKLLFGGHRLHLVCLPAEADLINAEGFRVRLPVRGLKDPVELDSRKLPGAVTAGPATGVNPKDYDGKSQESKQETENQSEEIKARCGAQAEGQHETFGQEGRP